MVRPARHRDLSCDVWPPQCRSVKEPQRAHLHANGIGRETAGHQVQMKFPQMLDSEFVGRSQVEGTELRYRTNVCLVGAWRQIAHRHIVDHALAQRRDRLGHRRAPVNWTARTCNPDRQEAAYRSANGAEWNRPTYRE